MTCDDYQIGFDQQQAGVSSAMPAAELDAHVAACAACTAYVSLSRKVSASMMNAVALGPPPIDVDTMRARVTLFRRRAIRWRTIGPLVFGVGLIVNHVFVIPLAGSLVAAVMTAALATALACGFLAFRYRRYLADLKALEAKSGHELLAGLRAELDRRIRSERQGWWVLPIVLALYHWRFAGLNAPSPGMLVFELCYLALIPIGVVRYRRSVRERALLA